jgi:hypothetical protein
MPKRLPINVARRISKEYGCRQVIVLAWDGDLTHIVTYGKTLTDASHAADGGNILKAKWGWPECNDQPARVRRVIDALKELIEDLRRPSRYPGLEGADEICQRLAGDIEEVLRKSMGSATAAACGVPKDHEAQAHSKKAD